MSSTYVGLVFINMLITFKNSGSWCIKHTFCCGNFFYYSLTFTYFCCLAFKALNNIYGI